MPAKVLADLRRRLDPLARSSSPLSPLPPRETRFGSPLVLSRVHWVKPQLVAEITYLTWTDDGLSRQTVFVGLRSDKPAGQFGAKVRGRAKSQPNGSAPGSGPWGISGGPSRQCGRCECADARGGECVKSTLYLRSPQLAPGPILAVIAWPASAASAGSQMMTRAASISVMFCLEPRIQKAGVKVLGAARQVETG